MRLKNRLARAGFAAVLYDPRGRGTPLKFTFVRESTEYASRAPISRDILQFIYLRWNRMTAGVYRGDPVSIASSAISLHVI